MSSAPDPRPAFRKLTESAPPDSPIFIVGVHRSGTTLLRYMLNSHARIYIPPESDFIPRFFEHRPHKPLSQGQRAQLLRIIFEDYRFVREWEGGPTRAEDYEDPPPTPAEFLRKLYLDYAAKKDAVRWGDKTPIYTSYLPLLSSLFPKAQFIHLLRDGRDVALSMLEKWGQRDFHIDLYFAARNWRRRTLLARREGARIGPGQYLEVHYEALVTNPEKELRRICGFLGERFQPEMATPHVLARSEIEPDDFHDPVRQPPSTDRISRWQREMSASDLWLFEQVAGDLLAELGYPLAADRDGRGKDRMKIYAYRAKYNVLQAGRSVLQAMGLKPPIG